jgi:hypothetical protein
MRYEVDIPDGKFCDNCQFCYEDILSFGMEESRDYCAILNAPINEEHVWQEGKHIKRLKNCPNYPRRETK